MDRFTLLHADDTLLVLDKPAGLLSVPGRGEAGADNLAARVRQAYPDALVVHRLDQATSGLMLFARGASMQRLLSLAFQARQVHKLYVAVVAGRVADDEGLIDARLAADWPERPRQRVDALLGKPALTRWRLLERQPERSRLALEPLTGRTHQLRVHLQSIGHPILGDALYAPDAAAQPRLMLHATHLSLQHPTRRERLGFDSPAPF